LEAGEGASGGFSSSHSISVEISGMACDFRLSFIDFCCNPCRCN